MTLYSFVKYFTKELPAVSEVKKLFTFDLSWELEYIIHEEKFPYQL